MIEICNLRKEKPKNIYDIKVDRSSILGNPFYLKSEKDRNLVCDQYDKYFHDKLLKDINAIKELERLKSIYSINSNLRLFCWCIPKRCHAETIKKYLETDLFN